MIQRSMVAAGLVTVSSVLLACGGSSNEPVTPDTSASAATSAAVTPPPPMPSVTASAVAVAPPPAAPEPGADVKIVAMKMSVDPKTGITMEIKADGTVWSGKGAKSTKIGSFSKNSFSTNDGKGTVAVWKDNSITVAGEPKKMHFDDKDNAVADDGSTISIDDKGKISFVKGDGKKDTLPPPTLTGFKPEGRRAAMFLTILSMMMLDSAVVTPSSVSVPPVPPQHP